jgi:Histidine kinase-, DNA gyrase B-, and HSP90-like ATPase
VKLRDILEGGGSQLAADVNYLTEYAAAKLITVRDTFPDYTLHNHKHAENVVDRMEELLGKQIDQVTPLEAAMLILAAYFHDIGMVYRPDEVPALLQEQEFKDYLDQNPTAFVRVAQAGEVPDDIILDYCRARHADRVSVHLYQLEQDRLAWQGVSFVEALATVCKSHNEPLAELRSERFETDFLAECDLRLCAILLRAADLLDFDQSRSPVAIYEHLRLDEAEGSRKVSQGEWSKHMATVGFVFPPERSSGYVVKLIARPKQPAVENNIRRFLDVVEDELRGCRALLDFCGPRWRALTWPGGIDRRGIVSQGYRWGDYRFLLDRQAVLQLFMGDRLYANPYVFIRELLQNAIDACRLNVYLHDADPESMEVHISAWEDSSGNYWFRVDDTGVGMDQHIVEKYFLGVGRSYYSSDELQADILRKKTHNPKFMSISRFGIGVLSTFIVGDHVEVSTRRRKPDGRLAVPLRISLDSLDDFFVLRDEPMPPPEFPARDRGEAGYRKGCGTSVAVRINPARSDVALDKLLEYAEDSLFYPPVKVYVNGLEWREREYEYLSRPFLPHPVLLDISGQMRVEKSTEPTADLLQTTNVRMTLLPLDLTKNSPTRHVRGQVVAVSADATCRTGQNPRSLWPALSASLRESLPADLVDNLEDCIVERYCSILFGGDSDMVVTLSLFCENLPLGRINKWLEGGEYKIPVGNLINELFGSESSFNSNFVGRQGEPVDRISIQNRYRLNWAELVGDSAAARMAKHWLGHNGVCVSTEKEAARYALNKKIDYLAENAILGPVCVFDELRPDVSVSRDALRDIPYSIRSILHLTVRRSLAEYEHTPYEDVAVKLREREIFSGLEFSEITSRQMLEDQQWSNWCKEKIFSLSRGSDSRSAGSVDSAEWIDIGQLCDRVNKEGDITFDQVANVWSLELQESEWGHVRHFYHTLRIAMLEAHLELKLDASAVDDVSGLAFLGEGRYSSVRYTISASPLAAGKRPQALTLLPPFSMVRYESSDIVVKPGLPANLSNGLVFWLAEQWGTLGDDYPALFAQMRRALGMVTNVNPTGHPDVSRAEKVVNDGAVLLNSALTKLRRSMKQPPDVLSCQIYADTENWALTQR